jgi:hypothetical protein
MVSSIPSLAFIDLVTRWRKSCAGETAFLTALAAVKYQGDAYKQFKKPLLQHKEKHLENTSLS